MAVLRDEQEVAAQTSFTKQLLPASVGMADAINFTDYIHMMPLFLSLLLYLASYDSMIKRDLTINDLMGIVGKPASKNDVLSEADLTGVTEKDIEDFLFRISHRITDLNGFTFLGLEVEQFYLQLESARRIEVVYITVDNKQVVDKLTAIMGRYSAATGISFHPDNPLSVYSWDYKGMCVELKLNAYNFQLEEKTVKDNATIVFNNCDMYTYLPFPRK